MKTCLLIEDDEDDQEIFSLALKTVDNSIRIIAAYDGPEAMKRLRSSETESVDFIFLDLNMPRMSGKQVLAELKKDIALKNIPVVIYTTSSDASDKEETKQLGAEAFITKPPYMKDLTEILRNFFSARN